LEPASDPRVYFAAERTLLAWVRTGVSIIALGFLIARFGFFLALVRIQPHPEDQVLSSILGVGLVLTGTFMVAASTWQQHRFVRSLRPSDLPVGYSISLCLWLSVMLAIAGALLAVFLALTTRGDASKSPPSSRPLSVTNSPRD
jgi:putative membrane protein